MDSFAANWYLILFAGGILLAFGAALAIDIPHREKLLAQAPLTVRLARAGVPAPFSGEVALMAIFFVVGAILIVIGGLAAIVDVVANLRMSIPI